MVVNQQDSGHMAGLLYFFSTLGSAVGTLGTSFYFVLWFEVNQILWSAIAVLLLAAAAIFTTHRSLNIAGAEVGIADEN
jgi:hypothetical protein